MPRPVLEAHRARLSAAARPGWLLLLLAAGCAREPIESPSAEPPSRGGPRVVSLSPALTQALIDLGAGDTLVGRTPFAPEEVSSVPVVEVALRQEVSVAQD